MADNHFRINRGVTFVPQASAPSNPQEGDVYNDATLGLRKYEFGVWGPLSGTSATGVTYDIVLGETVTANQPVYISQGGSLDGSRTAGRAYLLDPTNDARMEFAGFTTEAGNSGDTITIQLGGELTGFSSLSVGEPVYATGTGTFGATAPTALNSWAVQLGIATSATKLVINGAGSATAIKITSTSGAGTPDYTKSLKWVADSSVGTENIGNSFTMKMPNNVDSSIYSEVVVPDNYISGTELALVLPFAINTGTGNLFFTVVSDLYRGTGVDTLAASPTGTRSQTYSVAAPSSVKAVKVSNDIKLTDSTGKINSIPIQARDIIAVKLTRTGSSGSDTAEADLNLFDPELNYKGGSIGGSGGFIWTEVTSDTTIAAGYGYIANSASRINFTLPATMAQGSTFAIVAKGAGGWKISTGSGQTLYDDTQSASGSGAAIMSSSSTNCVEVICITADTVFQVRNKIGTLTGVYTFGYFAGGANPSDIATTDKLNFSAETMSALASAIPANNRDGAGGSGSDRGYIIGGVTRVNKVEKLLYSTDTYSALGAILGAGVQGAIGAQSTTKGYRIGGDTGAATNTIDSVQFSNDTRVSVSSTLNTAIRETAGCTNTGVAAYTFGHTGINTIQKLVFSGEVTSTPAATLSNSTDGVCGTYSSTKGYRESGNVGTTVIDALTFSNDTRATLAATLTQTFATGTGTSSASKGYVAGGNAANAVVNALTFATETNASITATLSGGSRQSVPTGLRV